MYRFQRSIICFATLRSAVKNTKRLCSNFPKVRVRTSDEEDLMRISFRLGKFSNFVNMKVMKHQQIKEVLSQIKLMANLHRKKDEIRKSVMSKYGSSSSAEVEDSIQDEDLEVSLLSSDGFLTGDTTNFDGWSQASQLKIGNCVYEINLNTPTIQQLTLSEYIIPGCIIRPHFLLECASDEDSQFSWYRSVQKYEEGYDNSLDGDASNWEKVGDGLSFTTSADDVGHKLKVVCTPGMGEVLGQPHSAISPRVIEAAPPVFPFQERHLHTKDHVDSDCFRCISYNILANCYVEQKRFPYCTVKGRNSYYRKQLLLKELFGYNADIICLQEVQERDYDYDLRPILKKIGFDGFYVRKGGRRFEGLAIFYRTAKFRAVAKRGVHLNIIAKDKDICSDLLVKFAGNFKDMSKMLAQDTAFQIVSLEHIDNPKNRIIVANTHLYSNKDMPEVRLIQSALCTSYAEKFLKQQEDSSSKALVFCGDFNSLPGSAACNFIMNGTYQVSSNGKTNSSLNSNDLTLHHDLCLASACGTPAYTNFTGDFHGCLDYIFYSRDCLSVEEVVPMVNHNEVTRQVALPSEFFPSDHLALVCTLKWNKWN